jgi:hypothetical protein
MARAAVPVCPLACLAAPRCFAAKAALTICGFAPRFLPPLNSRKRRGGAGRARGSYTVVYTAGRGPGSAPRPELTPPRRSSVGRPACPRTCRRPAPLHHPAGPCTAARMLPVPHGCPPQAPRLCPCLQSARSATVITREAEACRPAGLGRSLLVPPGLLTGISQERFPPQEPARPPKLVAHPGDAADEGRPSCKAGPPS